MKVMSIEELEKRILCNFNEKIKILEYKNMKSPIKFLCLTCKQVTELKIAENIFKKNRVYICTTCIKHNNKIEISNKIKKIYIFS